GVLHDADERAAVGGDGQTLHALIVNAADRVGGIQLALADCVRRAHIEGLGQFKRASALAGGAVKFVYVGTVFVGDVNVAPVVGDAQAFGVIPGIVCEAGVLRSIEVVGAAGEIELGSGVDRRSAGAEGSAQVVIALACAASVDKRRLAVEQGG